MSETATIVTYTLEQARAEVTPGEWERFDAMTDEEIDYSDSPELTEVQWGTARVVNYSKEREAVDSEILQWFKNQSKDCWAEVNQVLRKHIENMT